MVTHSLTLTLPEPVIQLLQEIAQATHQPLERIAQQSIEGNLPPSVANMPPDVQGELLALQTLSVSELRQIAACQVPEAQQKRHLALLEKNSEGDLTPDERRELAELRQAADRLMLRKAYAWAVLRWHGQPVPTLNGLPLD